MSAAENPYFRNIDRAPYELSKLLTEMGKEKSVANIKLMEEAALQHAENSRDALLRALAAIGELMVTAYGNDQGEVTPECGMHIGELLSHISCELQFHDQIGNVAASAEFFAGIKAKTNSAKDGVPS